LAAQRESGGGGWLCRQPSCQLIVSAIHCAAIRRENIRENGAMAAAIETWLSAQWLARRSMAWRNVSAYGGYQLINVWYVAFMAS
jgi:hypothetical protein